MAGKVLHLDDENFAETIASNKLVLVDFYADWCGPCRMMTPIITQFSVEMNGKVSVGKLDIDASQETTQRFGVTSIPTLVLFKNGQEVERVVGLRDLDGLKELVNPLLA